MNFIDFFAGIGGFHLGMEQAGHKCVGWVEWDKFARKSYTAIYDMEDIWNAKDIRNVTTRELPKADIWCFGSPCQNVSIAGNREGIEEGKQSSMFFEIIRLLEESNWEKKPSYLLMENVKGLLSSQKGWDLTEVLYQMDKMGYDVEWSVINSSEVVPQHRERIFIVGHLRGQRTRKVFPIVRKNGETNKTIKEVARMYPNRHSSDANSIIDPSGISHTVTAHASKDAPKIIVNQLGNISNSKSFGGNPQVGRVYGTDGLSPTLSTMQGGGQEPKIAIPVLAPDRIKKRQNGRRFKTNGEPEFTLTGQDRHGILTNDLRIRKLTPRECWRLQGFPDWAFDRAKNAGLSDSQLYKQAGNSVTVPVIEAIGKKLSIEKRDKQNG